MLFFLFVSMAGFSYIAFGQAMPDSITKQYEFAKTDSVKRSVLFNYLNKLYTDSSFLPKALVVIDFLKSKKDARNQDLVQLGINDRLSKTGDYARSLASTLEITDRFEQQGDKRGILSAYRQLSTGYYYAGDKEKDLVYGKKAFIIAKELNDIDILAGIANNISTSYAQKGMADSALAYAKLSLSYSKQSLDANIYKTTGVLGTLAEAFIVKKQYDSALIYSRQDLMDRSQREDLSIAWTLNDLSQIFLETARNDSSKYYAHRAAIVSNRLGFKDQLQRAYEYLSRSFAKTYQADSAYKYLQLAVLIKDSLYSNDKTKQVQGIVAREQTRLQDLEKEKLDFQNKIKLYCLVAGLVILGIIIFLLYKNNRQKQQANLTLQTQKQKVETTLQELKQTQQQLIQSEKMASLGELTAGIAHEIQNPLNFVNNFSEVNKELILELKDEIKKGNIEEVNALANDIEANEEKINHHGKRADAIVKGMLQHSRSSGASKEPTDINKLADEYLRLAYHGLRAKDKSFNATLKTDFNESIGNINIIPQDIGRVLLNLITNAFYAVDERGKQSATGYQPTVTLSTKKLDKHVSISVNDNGHGIPAVIIDKIFQPFFTTKPTGQGTGLGLSLAYDIVKAHGGELKVETLQDTGTTFTILLPLT